MCFKVGPDNTTENRAIVIIKRIGREVVNLVTGSKTAER